MPGIPSLATSQTALMVAWQFWILYNYSENARAAASIQLKPGPLLQEALLKPQPLQTTCPGFRKFCARITSLAET